MAETKNRELPRHLDPAKADFDLFSSPFYLIAHADFKFHEDLDKAIAKYGLDRATYRLLTVLMRRSPISIKDLSTLALLKRSTASRALERMRREGWVEHSLNKTDNRITDVYLTHSGRELSERVMQLGSRQLKRAVEGLEEKDMMRLVILLQTLVRNLSKLPIE
ncbi:MarR family winged helix-turn-helix transcriptional regulator [Elongatibacter sediminis]|uniref:MarR family transcriptional regulator n=1 Tax=Elongatibacter sediminis TaxID=3119006 RepID=A0AAW9R9E4_9GAMM